MKDLRENNIGVFLDRDGTISRDSPDHIKSWDELHFLPNTKQGIKLLNDNGFNIIIIPYNVIIKFSRRGIVVRQFPIIKIF